MKFVVVDGCVFSTDNATATVMPKSLASLKVKAMNKGLYKDPFEVIVSGATLGNLVQDAPITATITTSATKVKVDGALCVLENDGVMVSCPATDSVSGAKGSIPVNVKVSNAGQNKVLAV